MSPAGLEHLTDSAGKTASEQERAALLRAISPDSVDSDLIEVIKAWATLSPDAKASILAIAGARPSSSASSARP
jgi:hypothetical protein